MTGPDDRLGPLRDWITLWHSEVSALLLDREVAEAVQRNVDAWAADALALLGPPPGAPDPAGDGDRGAAAGGTGTAAPAGAAAAAVPPDPQAADRLADELGRLRERIEQLERQLAGLPPRS